MGGSPGWGSCVLGLSLVLIYFFFKTDEMQESHGALPGPNWLSIGKGFKFIAKKKPKRVVHRTNLSLTSQSARGHLS